MSMFCYQCQETAATWAATVRGVCGKQDSLSNLMDLLIYEPQRIGVGIPQTQ